jgi:hypothetical protein
MKMPSTSWCRQTKAERSSSGCVLLRTFAYQNRGFSFFFRRITTTEIGHENAAIELIELVVDKGVTAKEATEGVGIDRSSWYYWAKHGEVDHLLA